MICGSLRPVAWWDVMTIVWPLEGTETYFTPNISIEAHKFEMADREERRPTVIVHTSLDSSSSPKTLGLYQV